MFWFVCVCAYEGTIAWRLAISISIRLRYDDYFYIRVYRV